MGEQRVIVPVLSKINDREILKLVFLENGLDCLIGQAEIA
jgi:hypothetical protein